jgi:hypothetical protein
MVGPTAQLVALACHYNARVRGLPSEPFEASHSTARFCEFIRFGHRGRGSIAGASQWTLTAQSPDDWLTQEARPGRRAILAHQTVDPRDRQVAGFIGGGGRWRLNLVADGRMDTWEAKWEVGDRDAPDRRIWQVTYELVDENANAALPALPSLAPIHVDLTRTLSDILSFCQELHLDGFADTFRKANECLAAADPFALVYYKDLDPEGLLTLPAKQLLAACQAAWVFGGMGSWSDRQLAGTHLPTPARGGAGSGVSRTSASDSTRVRAAKSHAPIEPVCRPRTYRSCRRLLFL